MRSDPFGSIRMRSDTFGCVRMLSEISETFWKFSGQICIHSRILNVSGGFWRFLDMFGCIRMHSDAFGSFWKLPEVFGIFERNKKKTEIFGIFQTCAYQNYSNLLVSQSSPDIR